MNTTFYKPGNSILHRFDPRTKLIVLLVFLVTFFLPLPLLNLTFYLLALLVLILLVLGIFDLLMALRLILPILILVLVLTPPFHPGGTVLFAPWGLQLITTSGLNNAFRLITRFTGISLTFYIYMRTTDPDKLVLSLRWFGFPFSMALVLTISMRYIPYLSALYSNVKDAHKLRGLESISRGFLIKKIRKSIPIMTSVLIQSVKTIPVLAMALESRGLGRRNLRTSYMELKSGASLFWNTVTALIIVASVIITILLFP